MRLAFKLEGFRLGVCGLWFGVEGIGIRVYASALGKPVKLRVMLRDRSSKVYSDAFQVTIRVGL